MQLVDDWALAIGESREQQRRALLLLSAMANAYLWCDPDLILDVIPKNISIPLCGVAKRLGIQPALVHASIVLVNWRRLNPNGPIDTTNITTLVDLLGGRDEKWFFLLTVEIEAKGAPSVVRCLLLLEAVTMIRKMLNTSSVGGNGGTADCRRDDDDSVSNTAAVDIIPWMCWMTLLLSEVQETIEAMTLSFQKMSKKCDPYIFYHRVRPFLSGTKGNPTIPNGVVYDGCYDNKHMQCSGGSAAQSSLLPVLDATLGVQHKGDDTALFINEMREYMPKEHRKFILHVHKVAESTGDVSTLLNELNCEKKRMEEKEKRVVEEKETEKEKEKSDFDQETERMRVQYNECVESLTTFRNVHMEMVKIYIIAEMRKAAMIVAKKNGGGKKILGDSAGGKGTGGTGIMSFLKPVRNRTREKKMMVSSTSPVSSSSSSTL